MQFVKRKAINRSSHSQMLCKIGLLKNFAKFTGKCLCWSLFLIKFSGINFLKLSCLEAAVGVNYNRQTYGLTFVSVSCLFLDLWYDLSYDITWDLTRNPEKWGIMFDFINYYREIIRNCFKGTMLLLLSSASGWSLLSVPFLV